MRKTKIIATLGPATESPEMIGRLIDAGMNIVRLNMSHAQHDWVRRVVKDIRAAAKEREAAVGILMDTQGPAIRTGDLPTALDLQPGQKFVLTVRGEKSEEVHSRSEERRVGKECRAGGRADGAKKQKRGAAGEDGGEK